MARYKIIVTQLDNGSFEANIIPASDQPLHIEVDDEELALLPSAFTAAGAARKAIPAGMSAELHRALGLLHPSARAALIAKLNRP